MRLVGGKIKTGAANTDVDACNGRECLADLRRVVHAVQ